MDFACTDEAGVRHDRPGENLRDGEVFPINASRPEQFAEA
jgi:hypothetical protein